MKDYKYKVFSHEKKCANCKFFLGNRELTDNRDTVIVDKKEVGKCYYNKKPENVKVTGFCQHWSMWCLVEDLINTVKEVENPR